MNDTECGRPPFDVQRMPSWQRDKAELEQAVIGLIRECRKKQLSTDHDPETARQVVDLVMRQRVRNITRYNELMEEAVASGENAEDATIRLLKQWAQEAGALSEI